MYVNINRLLVIVLIISLIVSINVYGDGSVGMLYSDVGTYFEGYTLFSPLYSTTTYLIDMNGNLVHTWESEYKPGNSVYLLENGNLLRTGKTSNETVGRDRFYSGGYGGIIQEIDWDGNVVWEFEYSTPEHRQHHDVELLPNGNILFIAWEYKTYEEALAAGRKKYILSDAIWADTIIEVNRDKEIVWEWHAWDHITSELGGIANGKPVSTDITNPHKIDINYIDLNHTSNFQNPDFYSDWMHTNAIDYNPALDQIAIDSPNIAEFYIIDHSTANYDDPAAGIEAAAGPAGDILYRWGNPKAYGAGEKVDQVLYFEHDIQWIEPGLEGEGNFLIFNNGFGNPIAEFSSVLELESPADENGNYPALAPGEAYGPTEPLMTFKVPVYSSVISGAQRLPNGNTFICSGEVGRFYEVTPEDELCWEYLNPVNFDGIKTSPGELWLNPVFRAYRYAPDYPGFDGKTLIAGNPIEYIKVAVAEENPLEFKLFKNFPNPFNMNTTLEFTIPSDGFTSLKIYNVAGQAIRELESGYLSEGKYSVVWDGKDNIGIPVSAGMYIARLENNSHILANKMLLLK